VAHILNHMQLLKDPEYMDAITGLSALLDEHREADGD
jgi:hypothetical protein